MELSAIKDKIHPELYNVLAKEPWTEFRPCQEKAINKGLLDGKNMIVASPTASGKTLVAEIAAINSILETGGKSIYLVPLKSLAYEKYKEFKEKYEKLGVRVALAIGDLDSKDPWLANFDLIIGTAEKFDSLIRHEAKWISQIKVAVFDEVHMLNDSGRGPTLEILITLLKMILSQLQIIGLSATIGNPRELATWLNAELVSDSWRPVTLYQGVFLNDEIDYFDEKANDFVRESISDPSLKIIAKLMKEGKQALVFCPTKRIAESTAVKVAGLIKTTSLASEAKKALKALSRPTKQCQKLAIVLEKGISFHHAGLVNKQKTLIEDLFRNQKVKVICCTPTLAMGINMPADVTLMKSLKRFSGRFGSNWIPVLEYHQMTGRAGRPGKALEGFAVSLAKTEQEKELIYKKFILGAPEEIVSKLSVIPTLRTSLLGLIASGFIMNKKEMVEFFKNSFYGFQYGDDWSFEEKLSDILETLRLYGFVKIDEDKLRPTLLGRRVSELYIDPETAYKIIRSIEKEQKTLDFAFLQVISNSVEMEPLLNRRKGDYEFIEENLVRYEPHLLQRIPREWEIEYEQFIRSFKTALLLNDWVEEKSEETILEKYGVRPGEIYTKIKNAEWLLYSSSEIARILKLKSRQSELNKTRIRVKHGIKEELLPLIKLRGIGRFRARQLHRAGFKNLGYLRKAHVNEIARALGSQKIAKSVKEQIGRDTKNNSLYSDVFPHAKANQEK